MPDISADFFTWKEKIVSKKLPSWNEIPDIGLYMDQVIRLMDDYLSAFESEESDDKLITPSMINNYVKMGIIPAPDKKKYNRLHVALLIVVCVLKQIMSIADIKIILDKKLEATPPDICYNNFRDVVNESAISVFSIVEELTGGIDKFVASEDLIDISILVAIFSNVGKSISKKIVSLESAADAALKKNELSEKADEKRTDKKAEKKKEKSREKDEKK
ncbi:MAG: DUF1836 domain-containing protein [Clostridia bacterium]|nr:DUF1836 domain-containing protein [Clostridia bacterium]